VPAPGANTYQLPVRHPAVFERGVATTTRMQVYLDDALVAPSGGTYVLLDSAGNELHADDVTITASVATVTVPGTATEDAAFSKACREKWTLTVGGVQLVQTRPAAIALQRLEPPAAGSQVHALHPNLLAKLGSASSNLQRFFDEGWGKVLRRLWSHGAWPDAMVDTDQLVEVLLEQVTVDCYELLASAPGDIHWEKMKRHEAALNDAWARVASRLDLDQDGVADSEDRSPLVGTIHLNGAPSMRLPSWA
jgi:hypothetical protein